MAARPRARSWRRAGIRTQLLVLLLPALAALLALDSWTDYRAMARTVEAAYDQTLLEAVTALDEGITTDTDGALALREPFAVQGMFESLDARHKHLQVLATPLDPASTGAPPAETLLGVADLPAPPDDRDGVLFYNAFYRGYPVRVAALQREAFDGLGRAYRLSIRAAESTGRRNAAREALLQRESWQGLRMLAVTVLLVWLGVAWALGPLRRLRAALLSRPAGELRPLEVDAVPQEVAPLVDAVNRHIADHRAVLDEQAGFLADASHQLRTPLAIMMTQAGYALRQDAAGPMRESLVAISAQLERSRRLSDQLLALAQASRTQAAYTVPVDLRDAARGVLLQYLPLAREKDIDLGWDEAATHEPVTVRADAAELHEALANLLHNAIRHTPRNGRITVSVRVDGIAVKKAVADVTDSGPGLPQDLHETVFQRFRQGPAPVGAPTGGAGLGLAIARAYARRNGGDIVLANLPDSQPGLCASLVLSLAETGAPHPQ
jgi:two-component system sensor histidine kinase TctE